MNTEIARKDSAIKYGLLETATWSEISNFTSEIARKDSAIKYGLLETATWS